MKGRKRDGRADGDWIYQHLREFHTWTDKMEKRWPSPTRFDPNISDKWHFDWVGVGDTKTKKEEIPVEPAHGKN